MTGSAVINQDATAKDPWVNSATGLMTGSAPGAAEHGRPRLASG